MQLHIPIEQYKMLNAKLSHAFGYSDPRIVQIWGTTQHLPEEPDKFVYKDEEGQELTPAQVVEGYHVDVLAKSLIQELKDYVPEIPSTTPVHGNGWAMGDKFVIVTKQDYL